MDSMWHKWKAGGKKVTKEFYLELIGKLDLLITNEIEELDKLNALASKITQENDGMPHAPGTSDKVGNISVKIVMKKQEINDLIDLFIDLREEIKGQIRKLHKDEYDVLYKYYVLGMGIFNIADARNKSESWVKTIKKEGLKNIEINFTNTLKKILKLLT